MNKKKGFALATSVTLISSAFLAACSGGDDTTTDTGSNGSGSEGTPDEAQVLNLLEGSDIPSLNPTLATDSVSFNVLNNVMEGLYRMDENDDPTPGMAEDVDISEDGLTYTFKIREGATWSNGEPVTANDFEYGWKEVLNPDNGSQYAYVMSVIEGAEAYNTGEGERDAVGVTAVDEQTLEVKLTAPADYFLGLTSFGVFMPKLESFDQEQGENLGTSVETTIYNGPFKLESWEREQGWKMVKNEEYWDAEAVKLEEINFRVVKEVQTGVNLYENGDVDRTGLTSELVAQFQDSEDFSTVVEPTLFYLQFNSAVEALDNQNIRNAIDRAYDKAAISETLLANGSIPANYLVPKDFVTGPDGNDFRDINGDIGGYNVEEAQQLWEAGLEELGTDTVELEFLNYDSEVAKQIGEFIKGELEKNLEGMTVTIKQQPFNNKLELESAGDFEMSFAGWGPDYQDPMTFVDLFVTDGPYNRGKWSNEEFDALIESAKSSTDAEQRWADLAAAEKIVLEESAISPVYQRGSARLTKPYVKDIVEHAFGADYSYKWASIEGKE
ncbi:peptide ABC transporter substrate-binding protein [Exiguobacterium alkaliphilum]|uniref:Peptide ABC transporter substrate-binding protein n=1 Tax=Exiguobacterium alkaliphilum TaxID=1428684 RepID=A0ABT2KU83_9BACL|nr:peptide ABC transporter substrate-binding protein [Exiguobacterium alkaliphilum]MCT4794532.1 peptide ABC transporter substrate-binding protein [Exiguobacterium alkaliphilum]